MNAMAESIAVIVRYLAFTPVFTLLFVVTLFVLISFTPFSLLLALARDVRSIGVP